MQRQRLLLLGLFVGTAALLVLAPFTKGANAPNGEPTGSFTFSADPGVTVLKVTYSGGLSGDRSVYNLYGDGRLRMEHRNHSGTLLGSKETSLSFDEIWDFLGIAVDHGLIDLTPTELHNQMERRAPIVDAGTMTVEVQLTTYTRNGEELGPVNHQLRLYAPKAHLRVNPNSEAAKGFVELDEQISYYFSRGRSGSP